MHVFWECAHRSTSHVIQEQRCGPQSQLKINSTPEINCNLLGCYLAFMCQFGVGEGA